MDWVRKFLKENLISRSDYLNYAKTPFMFMVAYSLSKRQTSIFVFGAVSPTPWLWRMWWIKHKYTSQTPWETMATAQASWELRSQITCTVLSYTDREVLGSPM